MNLKTDDQFRGQYLTYRPGQRSGLTQYQPSQKLLGKLPREVDWRKNKAVTKVKEQVSDWFSGEHTSS